MVRPNEPDRSQKPVTQCGILFIGRFSIIKKDYIIKGRSPYATRVVIERLIALC